MANNIGLSSKKKDSRYGGKSDLIIYFTMTTVVILIFNTLLKNNYVDFWDFSSVPNFFPIDNIYLINGGQHISGSPFTVILSPGINLLSFIISLLIGPRYIQITALLWILVYISGLYYLSRQFTGPYISFLSSLIGLFNPGMFNLIMDSPMSLSLGFLPFFLAFYYKYSKEGSLKYLYLSILMLSFTTPYGPVIPSIAISMFSVEINRIYKQRKAFNKLELLFTLKSFSIIALSFTLFHLNVLLSYKTAFFNISSALGNSVPHFNIYQILTFQSVYPWENHFYSFVPTFIGTLIIISLLYIFSWGIYSQFKKKNYAILIVFVLLIMLLSYNPIFSFFFWMFKEFAPIFNFVDPFEYMPLISISFVILIAISFKAKLTNMKWLQTGLNYFVIFLIIFIITISGVTYNSFFNQAWSQNVIPSNFKSTSTLLDNATGVVAIIPSTYGIKTTFNVQSIYTLNGNYTTPTPSIFMYSENPYWISPSLTSHSPYYSNFYNSLYTGNTSSFKHYSTLLDIEYMVYIEKPLISGSWGSPYISSLSEVKAISNFEFVTNNSGVVILKNPDYSDHYNINITNFGINIHVNDRKNLSIPISLGITNNPYSNVKYNNSTLSIPANKYDKSFYFLSSIAVSNWVELSIVAITQILIIGYLLVETIFKQRSEFFKSLRIKSRLR